MKYFSLCPGVKQRTDDTEGEFFDQVNDDHIYNTLTSVERAESGQ